MYIAKSLSISYQCLGNVIIIYDEKVSEKGSCLLELEGVAVSIWNLIDGTLTSYQLVKAIAVEYEQAVETVEPDVLVFLDLLMEKGLIEQSLLLFEGVMLSG